MLALAFPLVLTQLTQILVHTTEVLLLGRLGAASLAAATLAAALFHSGMMFAIGVASATAPLIAQAKGARQPRQIRRVVRQGLWMTLAITLPLMVALWFARPLLSAMGQDEALLSMTEGYIRAALFGLPFSVGFIVLRSFVAAFGHARAILVSALVAALVNIPMSWVLIFGGLGFPALGTRGAGIAVAITFTLMFGLLFAYCLTANPFRRYNVLGRFWWPDWSTFREIYRVGFPIGGAVVLETGLFAASTLLMGLIGTAQLAAHQIALQLASIGFMVPLGLSHAATIRIGLAVGADDWPRARLAGWVACGLGTVFMVAMAVLFATVPGPLVGLFLDPGTPEGAAAFAFAVGFLRIAALFQLVDGLQVIGIASLRGLRDTAVPMWLAGFGYWVVGFPICWLLGFHTALGGTGIWVGLAFALATVALVMVLRFERLTRRRGGRRHIAAAAVAVVLTLAPLAHAFEDLPGELEASSACEAYVSFRKRSNPDGAVLTPGERYRMLGRNQTGGDWLQILVPNMQPQQRWVATGCGQITAAALPAAWLLPFFDDATAARADPSPPPPPLDALDRGVLEVCGPWGSRPSARDFRAMLDRPEVEPEVAKLYDGLDRAVRGGKVPLRRFKDELTDVWFDASGFEHVFCGEPRADQLGGMHYRGRYLDLQQQGIAGLMSGAECRATEIEPPVYTVGVRYRLPGGGTLRTACPKGYAYDLGAADLLLVATQAYRELRRRRGAEMCLEEIAVSIDRPYLAVVVVRGDAIRTFYPDLSPACDGGGRPASCACGE